MIPADADQAGAFSSSIGNGKQAQVSDDAKLKDRNEINLQGRKKRRSRRGRAA